MKYYLKNRGEEIKVGNNKIIIRKNTIETSYLKEDIKEAIVHKSASLDSWGIPFSAMEYYYYVEIIFNNNKKLIITSLMGRNVDKVLKEYLDIPFHREKSFFNTFPSGSPAKNPE